MAILTLYLDVRYIKENGAQLKLRIGHKKEQAYISLGINLKPDQWQSGKIVAHPQRNALNMMITNQLARYNNALMEIQQETTIVNMSALQLRDALQAKVQGVVTDKVIYLVDVWDRFAGTKTKERTASIYVNTLASIVKYMDSIGEDVNLLTFEQITPKWLKNYDAYLEQTSCKSVNGRSIHLRNIRAVINYAINEELIAPTLYPFRKYKIKSEETIKRSLSVKDIRMLLEYTPADKYEELALDSFKLSFYLIGMNVVDLYHIKSDDINGDRLTYRRAKTSRLYDVRIEPEALAVIDKHRSQTGELLLDFSNGYANYHNWAALVNDKLREIANKIGLPAGVTTYWGRHSWATIAADLEIPKETIAAALGHGGKSVTDVYINFNVKKIDEANRKVINAVSCNGDNMRDVLHCDVEPSCPF